jgi:hypothetical protein
MLRTGLDASATVIWPKYKKDKRLKIDKEFDPPPSNLYIPLGWDEDRTTKRKHYRKYYTNELENIEDIFPQKSPFNSYELVRGQSRGQKKSKLFTSAKVDASGQASTI